MQLLFGLTGAWHTILLFLSLLSSVYAAVSRDDLIDLYSIPIVQLSTIDEKPNDQGMYTVEEVTSRNIKKVSQIGCNNKDTWTTPLRDGDLYFIACCGVGQHLSGNLKDGLSCCGAGTDRKGSVTTGFACCSADTSPKGDVKSGKYACCSADQEYSQDEHGGGACCAHGTHASGNVASGKYQCCPTNQDYTEDKQGGGACCPKDTHVSGTVADKQYLCCPGGTERRGTDSTAYRCCPAGEDVVGEVTHGYACCPPDQHISGTVEGGQYLCCGKDHERSGSAEKGWMCCANGYEYDGKSCKPVTPACANGKQLINGACACPAGETEVNGECVLPPPPAPAQKPAPAPPAKASPPGPKKCESGVVTGKCYEMQNRNGNYWGWGNTQNAYTTFDIGLESAYFKTGKFQFCMDQKCTSGRTIDPGEGFSVRDLHGKPPAGSLAGYWLSGSSNGPHITKVFDYSQAGRFSITKWPCGLYCLGGVPPFGVSGSCPSDFPGYTFNQGDPQACIPIKLTEVPCDIHQVQNNCLWDTPAEQCCTSDCPSTVGAPTVFAAAGKLPAGQKPIQQNGGH